MIELNMVNMISRYITNCLNLALLPGSPRLVVVDSYIYVSMTACVLTIYFYDIYFLFIMFLSNNLLQRQYTGIYNCKFYFVNNFVNRPNCNISSDSFSKYMLATEITIQVCITKIDPFHTYKIYTFYF